MTQKIAMVFPGQGSQSVGMLTDVAEQYTEVKDTFTQASVVLGYDLWQLVAEGEAKKLDQTMYTQPALLAASYAIWRILNARISINPTVLAGHSLGEYTALVCAQALAFTDAIKLVAARGQYMQEAVAPGLGAMVAIVGLEEAAVAAICEKAKESASDIVSPANFNSLGQVVIAGHHDPVMRAMALAKEKGAKLTIPLVVSVPSHCALMQPAADQLARLLDTVTIKSPVIPVINNVDVSFYVDAASIKDGLTRQLTHPVRWVEVIQQFKREGVRKIVECGPGKVLTGLIKRIDKQLHPMTSADITSLNALLKLTNEGSESCLNNH